MEKVGYKQISIKYILRFMKRLIIIIVTIVLLFNSCSDKNKDYEQEVYSDILNSLINIDNYYKPAPSPKLILEDSSSEGYNELKNEYDILLNKYYQRIDTLEKYLFVKDTLQAIDLIEFIDYIEGGIFTQKTKPKKQFKIDKYNSKDFILIKSDSFTNDSLVNVIGIKEDRFYIGYLVLSRVIFNEDYTKGVLICSFSCGTKCGEKKLLLVSNQDGRWKISEKIGLEIF
jgi:hypothetical protein